jgi:hypothetical protein
MANTFDTSRVGGGTYELVQDANGNYNLNSVGFTQVNKLNLPDLKTSDTSVADTTKKATEDTIKAQTTEVFTPTNVYNQGGGGQDSSLLNVPTVKEATVKDATVRSAGETVKSDMPQGSPAQLSKDAAGGASLKTSVDPITGAGRSQSQKFQERFDPTKIQAAAVKPNIVERATTGVTSAVDSIKNNKAVQMASNVLGFVANPIMGGLKMVAGTLQESPQDKFNKEYFNLNPAESGGRIAGNPANNVFAGMNAVSAFGNVRSGALGRIETRNKTSEKLSGAKKENFDAKTKEFQDQVNKYDQDRADKKDAESGNTKTNVTGFGKSGFGRDTSQGGGDTGQGSGRVICTDLHKTGELSTIDWIRDTKFTFKKLTKTHVKGYLLWAEPTVKHIQKYPRYRKMWKHIAQHRANDIAWRLNEGKFDLLGRIYASIGEPVCWALGNFVSDKQINKYNLTHWRRA